MTLNELGTLLKTTGIFVSQFESSQKDYPYIVYNLYNEKYRKADNIIDETIQHIQVDYYTKNTSDGNFRRIKEILDDNVIPFDYLRFYDRDTKVIHHVFDCEVL